MRIYDMKINGVRNLIGRSCNHITCSWKVDGTSAARQKYVKIDIGLEYSGAVVKTNI